jgi:4,5-DOPA dioxygenase extradiol
LTKVIKPMTAAFIGHGSPMNALERNRYTESWRAFGATISRPRAILVVSAHWFNNATAVTAMPHPRTIHDFRGFPPELFAMEYPAPGSPDVAAEIVETVKPDMIDLDRTDWGLDHGTWSVLRHVFPMADIPVLQLSIHALQPLDYHLKLGVRLARLREHGVLILGSGNVVHNLGLIDWHKPNAAFDWARRFDDAAKAVMTSAPADIAKLQEHPDFRRSVPTPEHFLPLVYLAGLAAEAGKTTQVLIDGYAMGSLSMTAYTLDMPS